MKIIDNLRAYMQEHSAKICERCGKPYAAHITIVVEFSPEVVGIPDSAAFHFDTNSNAIAYAPCNDVLH